MQLQQQQLLVLAQHQHQAKLSALLLLPPLLTMLTVMLVWSSAGLSLSCCLMMSASQLALRRATAWLSSQWTQQLLPVATAFLTRGVLHWLQQRLRQQQMSQQLQ
jgi:hypothetical protein